MNMYGVCDWSRIICGFEILVRFRESPKNESRYMLNLSVVPATDSGKIIINKYIYFSTDGAVYDWFNEHSVVKFIDKIERYVREYYTAYHNLDTVFDLELSL